MNSIRQDMLNRGICPECTAYRGKVNKQCMAMSDGCPVPEDTRKEMEKRARGKSKANYQKESKKDL